MKQEYFIVVLAHSFHGRLRRVHIPHQVVYAVLALAAVGFITVLGFVGSYARMAWKVSDYNALREEVSTLRERYQALQQKSTERDEQLATLQFFATEVSMAYGIQQNVDDLGVPGGPEHSDLVPSFNETLEQYNYLKGANFSIFSRKFPRLWQKDTKPSLWPVNGHLSGSFGRRSDPFHGGADFHPGVDISAPNGEPVYAAGDGVVVRAQWAGDYGRLIVIDHGAGMSTYYGHLLKFEVVAGQEVRRGQVIGAVGNSGRVTGRHLHYEVRQGGSPVNPYIFLKSSARPARLAQQDFPF